MSEFKPIAYYDRLLRINYTIIAYCIRQVQLCYTCLQQRYIIKRGISLVNQIRFTRPLSTLLRYDQKNTIGKTDKLNMVLVIRPPITTIASGFDASDPMPCDIAAGNKPIAAIKAVITTGRKRSATPALMETANDVHVV